MKKFKNIIGVVLAVALLTSSCTLDTVNPNAPTDLEVLNTQEGIVALSVGMKQFYSTSGIEALYLYQGVTGRELKGIATFTNVLELEAGGPSLPTFNGNVSNLWSRMQRVMSMSDDIIEHAPGITGMEAGLQSGIVAHAKLFKAMALGALATAFEQANLRTSITDHVTFVPRQQVLTEAVRLLDEAIAGVEATPPSAAFTSLVSGASFRLRDVLYAYSARYNLMLGENTAARTRAEQVDLAFKNEFVYNVQSQNPVWSLIILQSYFRPRVNFGLPAGLFESADQRIEFYQTGPVVDVNGDPVRQIAGFFSAQNSAIPVFLPDEMKLIRAEAILRGGGGSPTDAIALIDQVRTQSSGDPFGVNAGLPAYSGATTTEALLLEVYRQRCAELYLTGQKVEDSRRFNRPAPTISTDERNRNFYPYPDNERLNNPNVPVDPAI